MITIPQNKLDELKCTNCSNYLSYFPITQSANGESFCGRCQKPEIAQFRAHTFEKIAQYLKFPCIYASEGCIESLLPSEIEEHENCCDFKSIKCPAQLDCEWKGVSSKLVEHCEEDHPTFVIKNNQFEIDILSSNNKTNLIVQSNELYILSRDYSSNTKNITFSITELLSGKDCCDYQIELCNGKRDKSLEFSPKSNKNITPIEVSIHTIQKKLNDPAIIIGVIKFMVNELPEHNMNMLEDLQCLVCYDYMIPPIRICALGHSVCIECKTQIVKCPQCEGDILDFKPDITLQKIVHQMIGPCKYYMEGCKFVSKLELMMDHQRFCEYGPQNCPLKLDENCLWDGSSKDLLTHLQFAHDENFIRNEVDIYIDNDFLQGKFNYSYLKIYNKKLFKLEFLYENEKFWWSLQMVGPSNESRLYKYDITLTDNVEDGLRTSLRNKCSPLLDRPINIEYPDYIFLTLRQVTPFIIDDHLIYKINIFK